MNFIKTFLAAILAFVVGSFLVFFLWIFILLGIAGSMEKTVAVHAESILKIDFSDVLTDAPSSDPFAGIDFATLRSTRQLPLMKALRALEAAKDDSRIKGIYLRMNGNGGVMGAALLEELREAVVDFKQSGKFVVAYDETYSQGKYYLASAADKIYMQPEGGMDWSGLSFNLAFYKGLLDKLDVKAEVFRPTACKYKSAVEPYILPKMSDANREQMQELVNSMWNTIAGSVSLEHLHAKCTSCHLCVSKCPGHVLQPAVMEYGLEGVMHPVMRFDKGYCLYECTLCGDVCPTGAILPLDKEQKKETFIGHAVFRRGLCVVHTDGVECGNCADHCPAEAIRMVPAADGRLYPEVERALCIGCGRCEYVCPASPLSAIHVEGYAVHDDLESGGGEREHGQGQGQGRGQGRGYGHGHGRRRGAGEA